MRKNSTAVGRMLALIVATASIVILGPVRTDVFASNTPKVQAADTKATAQADTPVQKQNLPIAKEAVATKPKTWSITSTPVGDLGWVNNAIAHYQKMGLTKKGTAMLVGNFLQEKPSAFNEGDPCSGRLGDGGLAHGFGQWHPGRRADMPCGFYDQLTWAVDTEMQRDGGGKLLRPLLFDDNATVEQIDAGIRGWERYGEKGLRYDYGLAILSQLD